MLRPALPTLALLLCASLCSGESVLVDLGAKVRQCAEADTDRRAWIDMVLEAGPQALRLPLRPPELQVDAATGEVVRRWERAAVLVEPRAHPCVGFAVRSVLHYLGPEWGLQIYHGPDNLHFLMEELSLDCSAVPLGATGAQPCRRDYGALARVRFTDLAPLVAVSPVCGWGGAPASPRRSSPGPADALGRRHAASSPHAQNPARVSGPKPSPPPTPCTLPSPRDRPPNARPGHRLARARDGAPLGGARRADRARGQGAHAHLPAGASRKPAAGAALVSRGAKGHGRRSCAAVVLGSPAGLAEGSGGGRRSA